MRKVQRFEDLIAWQAAMDLAVHAYDVSRRPPFARDYALVNQVHRAANSIPGNIAEGFDRGTRAEFHHFLLIAKASCAELRSHMYLAQRLGYLEAQTAKETLARTEEVSRIIGKLRSVVATQRRTPRR